MSVVPMVRRGSWGSGSLPKSRTIAALDLGSTRICCLIAEVQAQRNRNLRDVRQQVKVLGFGQTASRGLRAGTVTDMNEAECAIRIAVDAAERSAQRSVSEVVVTFSGGRPSTQMRAGRVRTETGVAGPRDIEFAVARAMENFALGHRSILSIQPVNHTLDGLSGIAEPLGLHGAELQSEIGVTTVDAAFLRNITQAVERAHLSVAGYALPAQAAARSALTADERKLGAIVIDIGGAVTSLALIREDKILAAESISLGGMHLTNDVAQGLSTSIAHAERMKTLWGTLIEGGHNEREMLAVPLLGERGTDAMQRVPRSHLTTILRARVEEIIEHCVARLATPAFAAGAGCRVILTGGTSQLPGLAELAAKLLQHSVRIGSLAAVNGLMPQHQHPGMAACVGTILLAAQPQPQYALPQETQAAFDRANQGYARRLSHWLAAAF